MITMILGKPGSGKSLYKTWLINRFCEAQCLVASNVQLTDKFPHLHKVLQLDDEEGINPIFDVCRDERPGYVPFKGRKGADMYYRAFWHYLTPFYEADGTPIPPPYSIRRLGKIAGLIGPVYWKIVVDEYDNYFDSMDFSEIPDAVRIYHKQHRKFKHDLFIGVQSLENLYNRIRRMAQLYIVCENTGRSERIYNWLPLFKPKFIHSEFNSPEDKPGTHLSDGSFSMAEARELFSWYETDQILGGLSHNGGVRAVTS